MTALRRSFTAIVDFLSIAFLSIVMSVVIVLCPFLVLTLPTGSPFLLSVPLLLVSIGILGIAMGIQLTLFPRASWIYSALAGLVVGAIDAALMQVRIARATFKADWSSRLFVVIIFVISALVCWRLIRNWRLAEGSNT